jgi:Cu(I)/Ag(I) efflux system protein CusF
LKEKSMKPATKTAAFFLTALLASCGQKAETNVATTANATVGTASNMSEDNMSGEMGNVAMPAGTKMAKGSGTVMAIDKAGSTVTLKHGAIPEAHWPAMTMTFKAQPQLLEGVAVGDKVAFDLALKGDAGEVTAIQKQ